MKIMRTAMGMLCISCMLSGCLTTSHGYYDDQQEEDDDPQVNSTLKHDDASFFSSSGLVGCAVGAGIGMLGTLIFGKDHAENFAMMAAAGCALGMGTNYLLDNVRANYASTEEQLDATRKQVEAQLKTARNLHAASKKAVAEDEQAVQQLKSDYQKGKTTYAALQRKDKELVANIQYLTSQKQEAKTHIEQIEQARAGVVSDAGGEDALTAIQRRKLKQLDTEIASLKSEIESINDNIVAYSEQRNSLKAG